MPENTPDIGAQVEAFIAEHHGDLRFKQVQLIKRVAAAEGWQADQIAANVAPLAKSKGETQRAPDGRFAPAPTQAPPPPAQVVPAPVRGTVQGVPTSILEMDESMIRSMSPEQVHAATDKLVYNTRELPSGAHLLRAAAARSRDSRNGKA